MSLLPSRRPHRPWTLLLAALLLLTTAPDQERVQAAAPVPRLVVEPDDGVAPLLAFIGAARGTLDGEAYLLTDPAVEGALESATARRVRVRINLDPHPFGTAHRLVQAAYDALAAHGVQVRWTSPRYRFTHAKYLLEDDARAWIGTMNWSASAFRANREFALVDPDPTAVSEVGGVFAADWAHRPYPGAADALVVSPINARGQLEGLIGQTKRTLDLYAEELNDPAISQALTAAVRRDVRVRLVTTADDPIGAMATLIPTVARDRRLYIHAKAIISDDARMYLGSENYSVTSLDHNREMGLILTDHAAIGRVEAAFLHDLAGASSANGAAGSDQPRIAAPGGPGAGPFAVRVRVSPDPIPYGAFPTLIIATRPGAICAIQVRYTSGRPPASYPDHSVVAAPPGLIREQGRWRVESRSAGGTARVTCTSGGVACACACSHGRRADRAGRGHGVWPSRRTDGRSRRGG